MKPVFAWIFPGGKKQIQKAAAVSGATPTILTVAANKLWLLLNISMHLTTDATVVSRYCTVEVRDTADVIKFASSSSSIAQSLAAQGRYWSRGVSATSAVLNGLGVQLLVAGEDINLDITAGVAGDAYDYLVEYLEIDTP